MASKAKRVGRPRKFTPALATEICRRIAEGQPLTKICKLEGMPHYATIMRWLDADSSFRERYARAREASADTLAHKIQDLAERVEAGKVDAHAGRVAIDAMKWIASKLKPKVYGERSHIEHSGAVTLSVKDCAPDWMRDRLEAETVEVIEVRESLLPPPAQGETEH